MSRVFKATVKDGRLVIDAPVELPEGATVTVYLDDDAPANDESELASPEEIASLADSIAQAERGEYIALEEFRAKLDLTR